jgi:hypothetical protein
MKIMTNRNFEDIDKLFREGLNPDGDHFTATDADWSKLNDRLDQNEKRKRGIFWISRLSGIAALILLFFVIRMLLPEDRNPIAQQAEVQQSVQELEKAKQHQPTASPEIEKVVNQTQTGANAVLAQNKPERLANAGTKDFGSNAVSAKNKASDEQLPQNQSVYNSAEKEIPDTDTAREDNSIATNARASQTVDTEEHNLPNPENVKSVEPNQSTADESLFAPNERPNELTEPELELRKLALSILAAPDYNGVDNLNNASIGNDFGLLVTLKLSKNWSLSTGGIYARKLYETGFNNYNPTRNIWTEYYPKTVNADCRVLDIPLNISYTFLARKNTTISIGSGISSYIMLREDYRFSYVEQDAETAVAYHVVNENQHWLKVLNFQATIEQRLNSRVSIGLLPYLKIPMSNIGFAGVKLQTLGMAVVLNWSFN